MAYFYWQGIWGDGVVCIMLWMLAGESGSKAKCTVVPSSAYRDPHELVCLNWYAPHADQSNDPRPEASPLLMICAESKAEALFHLITWVGILKKILTYQGTSFMSTQSFLILSSMYW